VEQITNKFRIHIENLTKDTFQSGRYSSLQHKATIPGDHKRVYDWLAGRYTGPASHRVLVLEQHLRPSRSHGDFHCYGMLVTAEAFL
jgi:hypothetical protein